SLHAALPIYFGASAVVDAHRQRQDVVIFRELLGFTQLADHAAPEPWAAAGPAHPHAQLVHFVATPADDIAVEAHQEPHFIGRTFPIFGRKRVRRDGVDSDLDGAFYHIEQ